MKGSDKREFVSKVEKHGHILNDPGWRAKDGFKCTICGCLFSPAFSGPKHVGTGVTFDIVKNKLFVYDPDDRSNVGADSQKDWEEKTFDELTNCGDTCIKDILE